MGGALSSLRRRSEGVVAWVYEHELLRAATLLFLCVVFFSPSGAEGRTMFVAVLLPLAGIGLFSAGRREITNSFVLWACLAYMATLLVAASVQPDASVQGVWREFRLSALVAAYLSAGHRDDPGDQPVRTTPGPSRCPPARTRRSECA